jgi:hypothetical protein
MPSNTNKTIIKAILWHKATDRISIKILNKKPLKTSNLFSSRGKFNLPSEVSEIFQFEPQSFKIGSLPPEISKSGNLNLPSTFSVKLDGKL